MKKALAGIRDRIIVPVGDRVLLLGDEPPPAVRLNYGRVALSVLRRSNPVSGFPLHRLG
jgi:hypothetical protein